MASAIRPKVEISSGPLRAAFYSGLRGGQMLGAVRRCASLSFNGSLGHGEDLSEVGVDRLSSVRERLRPLIYLDRYDIYIYIFIKSVY